MPEFAQSDDPNCSTRLSCRDNTTENETTSLSAMRGLEGGRLRRSFTDNVPFVAQSGRTLFLVADEPQGWVVAELAFDADACLYTLCQQSEYQWPREAFGRLLSRVMVRGELEGAEASRMSDAFACWLEGRFAA